MADLRSTTYGDTTFTIPAVDLSNYYTKSETNAYVLSQVTPKAEIEINESSDAMDITGGGRYASFNVNTDGDMEMMLAEPGTYLKTATVPSKTNMETALNAKQDTLVSGTNIKTVNGQSLLGSGNINIAGGGGVAALFDYATNDPIDMQGAQDIAAFMSGYLNLPGMATPVGTSNLGYKVPTVSIGAYTWTEPDAEGNKTATADVTIAFADGSTLTKTLNFKTGQSYRVYAARSTDGAYIDTGLTLNYAYKFRATGFLPGTNMGVFIGSLSSNTARTTARLLGSSQKLQHMWPGNTEYTAAQIGGAIAFSLGEEFAVQYSATEFLVWNESGVRYIATVSGKTETGTENVPILLFDETVGGSYKNAVIRNARIYDENGYEVRNYWPMMLNNEIVYVDTTIGAEDNILLDLIAKGPYSEYAGYVYHTPVGALEEVTQA